MSKKLSADGELSLFWKINALCSVNSEQFEPEMHLPLAESIVETLDDVIEPLFDFLPTYTTQSHRPINKYSVRQYVAEKYKFPFSETYSLRFSHAGHRERDAYTRTTIEYNKNSKELLRIATSVIEPYYLVFGSFSLFVGFPKTHDLWKKPKVRL